MAASRSFRFGLRRAQPVSDAEGRGRSDDVDVRVIVLVVAPRREQVTHILPGLVSPRDLGEHPSVTNPFRVPAPVVLALFGSPREGTQSGLKMFFCET